MVTLGNNGCNLKGKSIFHFIGWTTTVCRVCHEVLVISPSTNTVIDNKLPSVTTSSLTHLLPVSLAFSLSTPLPFWTFAVTFILNTAIQYFHWTLWLMVIYHQTKKRILSSEAIAETVTSWSYVSPHCDLDDSTPFCWPCDTPVYDSVSPYQVWLQQV